MNRRKSFSSKDQYHLIFFLFYGTCGRDKFGRRQEEFPSLWRPDNYIIMSSSALVTKYTFSEGSFLLIFRYHHASMSYFDKILVGELTLLSRCIQICRPGLYIFLPGVWVRILAIVALDLSMGMTFWHHSVEYLMCDPDVSSFFPRKMYSTCTQDYFGRWHGQIFH